MTVLHFFQGVEVNLPFIFLIDSEFNHIRRFIQIQFANKEIKIISLPSIFKDKSVLSSIHFYTLLKIRYPVIRVVSHVFLL